MKMDNVLWEALSGGAYSSGHLSVAPVQKCLTQPERGANGFVSDGGAYKNPLVCYSLVH